VNSEMHSEGVTERVWRCTCRVCSSEIGGVLGGGRFGGRRSIWREAVDLEGGGRFGGRRSIWREAVDLEGGGRFGGRRDCS